MDFPKQETLRLEPKWWTRNRQAKKRKNVADRGWNWHVNLQMGVHVVTFRREKCASIPELFEWGSRKGKGSVNLVLWLQGWVSYSFLWLVSPKQWQSQTTTTSSKQQAFRDFQSASCHFGRQRMKIRFSRTLGLGHNNPWKVRHTKHHHF